jgi:hypothetical protein
MFTDGATFVALGAAAPRLKMQKPYSIRIFTLFAPPSAQAAAPTGHSPVLRAHNSPHKMSRTSCVHRGRGRPQVCNSSTARFVFLLPRPSLSFSFSSSIPLPVPSTKQAIRSGIRLWSRRSVLLGFQAEWPVATDG